MELGDQLIQFELVDEEGQSIAPYRMFDTYDGILVIFYSSYCFYCQSYFGRLKKLVDEYKPDSLGFLFINIQNGQENPMEEEEAELIEKAQENKAFIKLVNDEDKQLAEAFGVKVTPEAFIFDKNQKLAYKGPIDNAWEHEELVTRVYLRDALDYTLDGFAVDFPEIDPLGTPINYSDETQEEQG